MNLLQLREASGRAFWIVGEPEPRGIAVRTVAGRFELPYRLSYDLQAQSLDDVARAILGPRGLTEPVVHIVRNAHLWEDSSAILKKWFATKKADTLVMESGLVKWHPKSWTSKDPFKPALRQYVTGKFTMVNTEFAKTPAGQVKSRNFVSQYSGVEPWVAKTIVDSCANTSEVVQFAQRIRNFPKAPDELITALKQNTTEPNFVHSLLQNKKADALKAPYSRKVFSDLAFSIDLVALMSRNQRMGESSFALGTRLGVHRMLVESHLPAVKFFDRSSMGRRLDCIAVASELWEQAENDEQRRAALVCLVAMW